MLKLLWIQLGSLQEKVVLCTDGRTFEIKEAGISNSLLLVPDLKLGQATSTSPIKSPKNRANTSTERAQNESTGCERSVYYLIFFAHDDWFDELYREWGQSIADKF